MRDWRNLAIYVRRDIKRGAGFVTITAINFYGDIKLKRNNAWRTDLADFERIEKYHNINIMLYGFK